MTPLNDDELNSLLEQAKNRSVQPSRELPARALTAYQANIVRRQSWRSRLLQPISIPWPAAVVIASLLIVIGALIDHKVHDQPAMLQSHSSSAQEASNTPAIMLSLKEFRPVSEIKPRVVKGARDDR